MTKQGSKKQTYKQARKKETVDTSTPTDGPDLDHIKRLMQEPGRIEPSSDMEWIQDEGGQQASDNDLAPLPELDPINEGHLNCDPYADLSGASITEPDGKPFGEAISAPDGWDWDRIKGDQRYFRGTKDTLDDVMMEANHEYEAEQ